MSRFDQLSAEDKLSVRLSVQNIVQKGDVGTNGRRTDGQKSVRHTAFSYKLTEVLRTIRQKGYQIGHRAAMSAGLGAHAEVRKSLARAKLAA